MNTFMTAIRTGNFECCPQLHTSNSASSGNNHFLTKDDVMLAGEKAVRRLSFL